MQAAILLDKDRTLSYAEYGNRQAEPVFYFHGLPGSRLERVIGDLSHVRLIVADRPGYGGSTLVRNRTLLDWVVDIEKLADSLNINKFSLIGFSSGGPYAAACAYKIPHRLNTVFLVSSFAPFDVSGLIDGLPDVSKELFIMAAQSPEKAAEALEGLATSPETLLQLMTGMTAGDDLDVFNNASYLAMYRENIFESIRQGSVGIAYDAAVIGRPWGFSVDAITKHANIFYGEQDLIVPNVMSQYLVNNIPKTAQYSMPTAGHYLVFSHWHELLALMQRTKN